MLVLDNPTIRVSDTDTPFWAPNMTTNKVYALIIRHRHMWHSDITMRAQYHTGCGYWSTLVTPALGLGLEFVSHLSSILFYFRATGDENILNLILTQNGGHFVFDNPTYWAGNGGCRINRDRTVLCIGLWYLTVTRYGKTINKFSMGHFEFLYYVLFFSLQNFVVAQYFAV